MVDAMRRGAHACPDDETLAAFIDGKLAGPERERVVGHLADCPDCYVVFSESTRTAADEEAASHPSGFRSIPAWWTRPRVMWPSVVTLATAAAAVLALWLPGLWSTAPELQELVAAVGMERTVEPRLSGGFAYAPLKATRGTATEASPAVRIAAAKLEQAVGVRRTPANLDAVGVAHLVTGRPADAVEALESATREMPNEARYWSDLAAAYLSRAGGTRAPDDLTKAANAADRATGLSPKMPEAWFNRALAIELIPAMRDQAKTAWDDYLKIDGQSPWADEAKQHLARLSSARPAARFDETAVRSGSIVAMHRRG